MIKSQEIKNGKPTKSTVSTAINNVLRATLVMSAFSMLLALFAGSTDIIMAYAEQTDTINASKIVNASKDKVWEIVSDVDKNPDYWPITIENNINKSNNTVEREVTIPAPPFMGNKAHQVITINPEQFTITENQTQGAVTGVKTISLLQTGSDANKTEINIVWNLDLSKIPGIGQGFAKDGIGNSVGEALDKIANTVTK